MTETRPTTWPILLLGTLSLAAGYAWGRLRPEPEDFPENVPSRAEDALVAKEGEAASAAREVPSELTETAAGEDVVGEGGPAVDAEPSLPEVEVDRIASLVESLADAAPEAIARLPWDRRVRAAVDQLPASGGETPAGDGLPPGVLAELLSALLARAALPLGETQRAEVDRLAAEWRSRMDRRIAELGDDALAIERELVVVAATDEFLEEAAALLDDRQMAQLDAWTPEMLEWPAFLSPLTRAPVARRELRREEIPDLQGHLSRDLARDFGLDPREADVYAADFLADVEPLFDPPARREEIVEWTVAFGEASARLFRTILLHPAVDAAARRRIRAEVRWLVPVIAAE